MYFNNNIDLLFTFTLLIGFSIDCNALDVKTTSGLVSGQTIHVLNQSVDQFIGIPFAEPPVGALRFQKPKPITKPRTDVIDATKTKGSCMQTQTNPKLNYTEDCLYLNIWTQSRAANDTKLKPVMFWIYGGGLVGGSIFKGFNGSVLATQDVVFVSTNYRLGSFGFLYGNHSTAPGNLGFYDQNLALRWVHENIHLFGGDKSQITIFGESAGSWSTSAHLLSPLSSGLFKRAIMQSGSLLHTNISDLYANLRTPEEALLIARSTAKRVNCTDDKQWLECLKKVDAKKLQEVSQLSVTMGSEFLPIDAKKAFEEIKFNKDLDLIAGVVKNEGSLAGDMNGNFTKTDFERFVRKTLDKTPKVDNFVDYYLKSVDLNDSDAIRWRIYDFYGDYRMKCPTYLFAKRYAEQSSETNVYFYEFTHSAANADYERQHGVTHGSEIAFTFGSQLLRNVAKEDLEFTKSVVKYWTDFAKYGKPNRVWPLFVDKTKNNMDTTSKILNPKEDVVHNYFNQCETIWKNYFI